MPDRHPISSPQACARIAGALYLVIIVCGLFGEIAVRTSLVVPGNAVATANNILDWEVLFRLGFAADTLMALSDVALAVLLYVLLAPVSPVLSLTAAAFRLVQTAILGMNLLNHHAALLVLKGAGRLTGFDADQVDALAFLFLEAHGHGYDLGLLFFGANSLIVGFLVFRSTYFPRFLGILLAAAGLVYLAGSYLLFLAPEQAGAFEPVYVVPLAAEAAFCLWLLVKGVDATKWGEMESRSAAA